MAAADPLDIITLAATVGRYSCDLRRCVDLCHHTRFVDAPLWQAIGAPRLEAAARHGDAAEVARLLALGVDCVGGGTRPRDAGAPAFAALRSAATPAVARLLRAAIRARATRRLHLGGLASRPVPLTLLDIAPALAAHGFARELLEAAPVSRATWTSRVFWTSARLHSLEIELARPPRLHRCVARPSSIGGITRLRELIDKCGLNPNVPDFLGRTPLHFAASAGNEDAVRLLVSRSPASAADLLDRRGRSPLMLAALYRCLNCFSLLAEIGDVNTVGEGVSVLEHACRGHHRDIISLVLSNAAFDPRRCDRAGRTLLMRVGAFGDAGTAAELLSRCANATLNARDRSGWTALIWAAFTGCSDVVRVLLAAGADVTMRDGRGFSAASHARIAGHDATFALLRGLGDGDGDASTAAARAEARAAACVAVHVADESLVRGRVRGGRGIGVAELFRGSARMY